MDRAATISLAVDPALIAEAKGKGVDLEDLFERALKREIGAGCTPADRWSQENKRAIASMNQYVEQHGLLSDHYKVD